MNEPDAALPMTAREDDVRHSIDGDADDVDMHRHWNQTEAWDSLELGHMTLEEFCTYAEQKINALTTAADDDPDCDLLPYADSSPEDDSSTDEDLLFDDTDEDNNAPSQGIDITKPPTKTTPSDEENSRPIRLGTWNVNKGYNYNRVLDLVILGHVNLLSIQEPLQDTPSSTKWAQWTISELAKTGFNAVVAKHNMVIYHEATIGRHLVGPPIIEFDGRIIRLVLKPQEGTHLAIFSIYGVCNSDGTYSDGVSRAQLRKAVLGALRRNLNRLEDEYTNLATIVMGDMQEEIEPNRYHCHDSTGLKRDGIIRYLMQRNFRCDVLETLPDGIEYKTRQALSGNKERSALDYIWTCPSATGLVNHSFVDVSLSRSLITSDHDLVAADLDLSLPIYNISNAMEESILYKRVSQIKVAIADRDEHDGSPIFEFDESQFMSREKVADKELLDEVHTEANKPDRVQFIDELTADMDVLMD